MSFNILKKLAIATIISIFPVVSFATEGIVDGNAVRLRTEPSSDSKIITLLEKGTVGEVHEEKNGWLKVTIGGNTGWVSSDYFKSNSVATLAEVETELKTDVQLMNAINDIKKVLKI